VAVFGAVLVIVFNHSLDQQLSHLALSATVRSQVDAARPQLAAVHNTDPTIQHAINESFLSGYRAVIWIATGLSALAGICARMFIEPAWFQARSHL
jgi:hypothetical protein